MPFIFHRPQEWIVPLSTLVQVRQEAFARTKKQLEENNERLRRLLALLQEIEESQQRRQIEDADAEAAAARIQFKNPDASVSVIHPAGGAAILVRHPASGATEIKGPWMDR